MSTTHFKLIQRDGFTRRVSFSNQPTWSTLAAKIESLYAIPIDKVSVAYIDADGDEVTLSSQEELYDFYQVSHEHGQIIKFIVQDLTSSRVQSKALPDTPHSLNFRHTFGQEGPFGIDDDWQRLPPFSGLGGIAIPNTDGSESPHAFVEVLSDVTSNHDNPNADSDDDNSTILFHPANRQISSPTETAKGKGKGKVTTDEEISSTGSVLGEDAPPKHPLHVYDISSRDQDASQHRRPTFDRVSSVSSTHTPLHIVAESTPKNVAQALPETKADDVNPMPTESEPAQQVEDPPLPPLDSASSITPSSLSNDIASLLTAFSGVVAAHPELSEGIRNIIHNASTGIYWNAQRDTVSRAAEDMAQHAGAATEELRRKAEEEAGQRVADALGGMFRTLSQAIGTASNEPVQPPPAPAEGSGRAADTVPANSTSFWYGASPPRAPAAWRGGAAPHLPHATWRSRPPFGQSRPSWGSWAPPPPHLHATHRSPLGPRGDYTTQGPPHPPQGPLPPPPPPPPGNWFSDAFGPFGPAPAPPPPAPPQESSRTKPTPQELRAQVEEAKTRYKAEKERYRLEREERRKERMRKAQTIGGETPSHILPPANPGPVAPSPLPTGPSKTKPAAIVSTGRAGYPALELVSVHRHNTHPGHGQPSRRHGQEHNDFASRTLGRITKRLADMGFTENAYPDLPSKIRAQIPINGVVSKDAEDDIVTTMLEELLAMSPKPLAHSAFASGDRDIPGAWH